jgi:hypothetical protein
VAVMREALDYGPLKRELSQSSGISCLASPAGTDTSPERTTTSWHAPGKTRVSCNGSWEMKACQ